jgi:hypothetical protein
MLAECARLHDARQAREDGLIQTVIQISSAALLAVPSLLLGTVAGVPGFNQAHLLYGGGALFMLALSAAMLEQHLSSLAFRGQIRIVQDYYLKVSEKAEDVGAIRRLRISRYAAYGLFAAAVLATTFGLINIGNKANGKAPLSTIKSTFSPHIPVTTPITTASEHGRSGPKVGSGVDTSATSKTR